MLRVGMISDDLAFWRAVCGSITSQVDSGVCCCHCHCLSLCQCRCHRHFVTLSLCHSLVLQIPVHAACHPHWGLIALRQKRQGGPLLTARSSHAAGFL